ncbi:unnamed protein product, partial [marine sediment metagenome]
YDYKDGLVYIDKNQTDGNYYESKMLWGMGNFSRFIRPGMKRVAVYRSDNATPDDTVKDLMVSAYYKSDDGIVVVVFVNWANEDKPVEFNFPGVSVASLVPYVTKGNSNSQDNLTAYIALKPDDTIAVPARSVVTIVGMPFSPGDCDEDGKVDSEDLAILAAQWRETNCDNWSGGELTGNNKVDFEDLAVLAHYWLGATKMPPLPAPVSNPNPYDSARDIDLNADLEWTAGDDATSHDVYFGTSNPPPFVCNQTATIFDPNTMAEDTVHYWRIDAVNMWGTTTSVIWRF